MKRVRGAVGIGILNGKFKVNFGTLIRSARLFGADFTFTVGRRYGGDASAVGHDRHIPVLNYDSPVRMSHAHPESTVVGVELDEASTELPRFDHPEKSVYLLGAEDHGLTPQASEVCDALVSIPAGPWSLNVAVAGSIVLYDRARDASEPRAVEDAMEAIL